jgi:hypothetical protein
MPTLLLAVERSTLLEKENLITGLPSTKLVVATAFPFILADITVKFGSGVMGGFDSLLQLANAVAANTIAIYIVEFDIML